MRSVFFTVLLLALLASVRAFAYSQGTLLDVETRQGTSTRENPVTISRRGHFTTVYQTETYTYDYYVVKVQLDDMIISARYTPGLFSSYTLSDLVINDPISVRLDNDHLYLRRPNGKEAKTKILTRTRISSPAVKNTTKHQRHTSITQH